MLLDRKVIGLSGWTHALIISTQNDRTVSFLCVRMFGRSNSVCPLNHYVYFDSLLDLCSINTWRKLFVIPTYLSGGAGASRQLTNVFSFISPKLMKTS